MAHMGKPEGYEMEFSDDDPVDDASKRMGYGDTDKYIEKITGKNPNQSFNSGDDSASSTRKRKRETKPQHAVGIKVEFNSDDSGSEEVLKTLKERKKEAKKRENEIKKKIKQKQKAVAKGKATFETGSEDEMVDPIPPYITSRRKKFDKNFERMAEAGLLLPPDYTDIDIGPKGNSRERPDFPSTVEPSRLKKDIELPRSGGVIPAPIAQYLRTYQVEGVEFMHNLFVYQKGGILGDDMGLGKTVQVAAFLTVAFGKTADERDQKRMRQMRRMDDCRWYPRVLIVCPGSLIENWIQELQRWGWWHVDKYHKSDTRESVFRTAAAGRLEIIITTYDTYKIHQNQLNLIAWDCVVADECHQLKDRKTATCKAMNEVNALCRIGLTGTAIQNKYEELWTLLNWTNPGRLGAMSTWKSSICEPLRLGQSHDATNYEVARARLTAQKLAHNLLPQFFLRRMKSLIAHQLPKKTDHVVFCPLTEVQREAYETFLASPLVEIVKHAVMECECESGKTRGRCCYTHLDPPNNTIKWQTLVFPTMQNLQKLSNHLALMAPNSNDPPEKQQRDLQYLKAMMPRDWEDLYLHRDSLFTLAHRDYCGKWRVLKQLLAFWHQNGDKVLIFSHSVRLLKSLCLMFKNTSYNVSYLDGSLDYVVRQEIVDDFNGNPSQFVFLISTKAGGMGLNITSANKVVIMDPNWNPAYDLQAQDRAYRIGQLRDVQVFRLISAGTIEEIVYARQIYKQQQANIGYNASSERRYFKGVQSTKGQQGEIFGLSNLLTYHANNVVLRDIVNKTNVAEMKAGVDMVDIDFEDFITDDNPLKVDDDDEGEGAISQLAALIAGDEANPLKKAKKQKHVLKKADPIRAILASAGVEYTHENSEIIGSSKVEERLSSKAVEAGKNANMGEQKIFGSSQQELEDDPIEDEDGDDSELLRKVTSGFRYRYNPPEDIMKRQFGTMSQMFYYDSVEQFALAVEQMTQAERRDLLASFYKKRRARLVELDEEKERRQMLAKVAKSKASNAGGKLDDVFESDFDGADKGNSKAIDYDEGEDDDLEL